MRENVGIFKNNEGKGENAGNQHFLLFPQCFLSFENKLKICVTFHLSSADAFYLGKNCLVCKRISSLPLELSLVYSRLQTAKVTLNSGIFFT